MKNILFVLRSLLYVVIFASLGLWLHQEAKYKRWPPLTPQLVSTIAELHELPNLECYMVDKFFSPTLSTFEVYACLSRSLANVGIKAGHLLIFSDQRLLSTSILPPHDHIPAIWTVAV